jgi:hypothetical protein
MNGEQIPQRDVDLEADIDEEIDDDGHLQECIFLGKFRASFEGVFNVLADIQAESPDTLVAGWGACNVFSLGLGDEGVEGLTVRIAGLVNVVPQIPEDEVYAVGALISLSEGDFEWYGHGSSDWIR